MLRLLVVYMINFIAYNITLKRQTLYLQQVKTQQQRRITSTTTRSTNNTS